MYACFLASMLYLHVSLSRFRLCHALCPLWVCACVVTSVPPRVCLDVTTCEIHPRGVGVFDIHTFLYSVRSWMVAMLALRHPFGFFCFLASLHACLHVHAWFCVSSIRQSNGAMETRSKSTFVPLGHPLLFANMLVFFFMCLTCLCAPVWQLSLACL